MTKYCVQVILQTDTTEVSLAVGFAFFSWVWRKRQDECKCSCLIYEVDMKFTKAIFDCEGLLELKKIRHPTYTLF